MHSVKELAGKKNEKKKKMALQPGSPSLSCAEKKKLADEEEGALQKQIQALKTWTDEIDAMNDQQLKEYLKNRPSELKSVKIRNTKSRPKVQRAVNDNGIMASVWKFHKSDNKNSCAESGDWCPENVA